MQGVLSNSHPFIFAIVLFTIIIIYGVWVFLLKYPKEKLKLYNISKLGRNSMLFILPIASIGLVFLIVKPKTALFASLY